MIVNRKIQPAVRRVLEDLQAHGERIAEGNAFGPDAEDSVSGGASKPGATGAQQKPIPPGQAKKATMRAGSEVSKAVSNAMLTGSRVAAGAGGGPAKRLAKGAQDPIPAQETPEQEADELEAAGKAVQTPADREALQAVVDREKKKQNLPAQARQPGPGARAPGARMESTLEKVFSAPPAARPEPKAEPVAKKKKDETPKIPDPEPHEDPTKKELKKKKALLGANPQGAAVLSEDEREDILDEVFK